MEEQQENVERHGRCRDRFPTPQSHRRRRNVTPERSRSMQPFQVEKPRRPCGKGITRWENLAIHDLPLRKTMKEVFGAFSQGEFKKLIPTGLEKPLQVINPYDKTTDSDEQVKNIEAILNYHNVIGAVKCKIDVVFLHVI
jgi:hypothetical protein